VMHVDFKVPSEHLLHGERFDAEMQIFHLHPGRRRLPTQSVLIRATDNGHNYYFDEALKAFEYVYDTHRGQCARKRRRERQ
jgi:carbonic anhydrase